MNKGGVKVLLSIGANLGDRLNSIKKAIHFLEHSSFLNKVKISSVYESEPLGVPEQPWFLNLSISAYTDLSAEELLFFAKSIEYFCDRKRRQKWHEREIDIDLILYGSDIIRSKKLSVPHLLFAERKFVLIPSAEIEGDMIDPISHQTLNSLLVDCKDNSVVKPYIE